MYLLTLVLLLADRLRSSSTSLWCYLVASPESAFSPSRPLRFKQASSALQVQPVEVPPKSALESAVPIDAPILKTQGPRRVPSKKHGCSNFPQAQDVSVTGRFLSLIRLNHRQVQEFLGTAQDARCFGFTPICHVVEFSSCQAQMHGISVKKSHWTLVKSQACKECKQKKQNHPS
ncbi:hypothetical protein B0H17DRAFT_1146107 [Mycena rosella]|uniref:Uncharacterized protein n=1 Tax=Mycena rosella TaxID=1033263 RepID=A0AAD7G573_MYCRO|nr:hypothetical protein B0H17DRAFT_1146107 [Mycena rosella]